MLESDLPKMGFGFDTTVQAQIPNAKVVFNLKGKTTYQGAQKSIPYCRAMDYFCVKICFSSIKKS
jgi:hypothetical protein